jgi:hypothetical protein
MLGDPEEDFNGDSVDGFQWHDGSSFNSGRRSWGGGAPSMLQSRALLKEVSPGNVVDVC